MLLKSIAYYQGQIKVAFGTVLILLEAFGTDL
jgi:hypothetical protein